MTLTSFSSKNTAFFDLEEADIIRLAAVSQASNNIALPDGLYDLIIETDKAIVITLDPEKGIVRQYAPFVVMQRMKLYEAESRLQMIAEENPFLLKMSSNTLVNTKKIHGVQIKWLDYNVQNPNIEERSVKPVIKVSSYHLLLFILGVGYILEKPFSTVEAAQNDIKEMMKIYPDFKFKFLESDDINIKEQPKSIIITR